MTVLKYNVTIVHDKTVKYGCEFYRYRLCLKFFPIICENTRCTSMKCGFQTTDVAPEQFVLLYDGGPIST